MTTAATFIEAYKFNRGRTLGLLETIEKMPEPHKVLGWRPGPGRAHIAWQLMHVGITEELFATERLAPNKAGAWTELWPRFRGGSTPDDDIPSPETIREILSGSREHLVATLTEFGDDRLNEIPAALAARQLNMLAVLHILGWHEGHHQGQAHITLNLYKAQHNK
jgi:hypothetical protein